VCEVDRSARQLPAVEGAADVNILTVVDVTKRYGHVVALDGISFSIRKGSITALLGGNGAGKTTTLSILLGLLIPTSGSVTVFGEDMLLNRYCVLGRMNFASPYVDLPKRLTGRQSLNVYGHLYGLRDIKNRIARLSSDLEMQPFLDRPASGLSAGQMTRLMLAKALLNEPDLLLLDEPTASLDPDTGDWVRGYLQRFARETGGTILLASHNMGEVERLCDRVLMLRAGIIVDDDSPSDLIRRYGRQNLEEVFLDIARNRRTGTLQGKSQ